MDSSSGWLQAVCPATKGISAHRLSFPRLRIEVPTRYTLRIHSRRTTMPRPLTPDLAEFWLQDILLGRIKHESLTTRRVLEAVPADKGDYRPDTCSRTSIELVRHIPAADIRFLESTVNAELF